MLVSAVIANGPPSRLIEQAVDGRIELILAPPVLDELRRVLTVKLGFAVERWHEAESVLLETCALLATGVLLETGVPADVPPPRVEAVSGDPDDDLILAWAVAARVDVIVSGDRRHLLPLKTYYGIPILTPQALLAELLNPEPS